jgi:hypothetical protein
MKATLGPRSVRYVRYSLAEWAAVEAAAAQAHVPPSTYVRHVSVRAAHRSIARPRGTRVPRSRTSGTTDEPEPSP